MNIEIKYCFAILASCFLLAASLIGYSWSDIASVTNTAISQLPARTRLAALEGAGSGLVGWWKYDEASGASAADASGAGNNGTLVNGPVWGAGKFVGALQFDGANDYVNIGNTSQYYNSSRTSGTFSVWVNSSGGCASEKRIFSMMRATGMSGLVVGCGAPTSHKGYAGYRDSANAYKTVESTSDIDDGAWHNIVWIVNGSAGQLYVDGSLQASASDVSVTNTLTSGAFPADIGAYNRADSSGPKGWNGLLDDVRIYDHALTSQEISDLFSGASAAPTPPPASDTTAPSVPAALIATAISSSQIDLSWSASTDDIAVTGYKVFRDGTQVSSVTTTSYSDTSRTPDTAYSYSVLAFDAAGNSSAQTSPVSARTQPPPPPSTEHYIRAGATGTTCSDWGSNACATLPATLVRGHTYYVAGGSYGAYIFDDTNSGTIYITVKKATDQDHGTGSGWSSGYGSQAVFANLTFRSDYYIFDGVTGGGPRQWETGFGFRVYTNGRSVYFQGHRHDIELRHLDMENQGRYTPDAQGGNEHIIYSIEGLDHIKVSYSYLHEVNSTMFLTRSATDIIVEYNKLARNGAGGTLHREAWSASDDDNITIRYNIFEDISGTAFIALVNGNGTADNWNIYGNVFWHTGRLTDFTVAGIILTRYASPTFITPTNWKIFNNIITNIRGTANINMTNGSNNLAYNNIWYNNILGNTISAGGATNNYNWYYNNIRTEGCNPPCNLDKQNVASNNTIGTGDPFVDWRGGDFTLKAGLPGLAMASPFNQDPFGNTRGSDGVWDIGVYEYLSSGGPPPPTPPPSPPPTVTPTPVVLTYTLNLSKSGTGSGTVTAVLSTLPSPTTIVCGSNCTTTAPSGTTAGLSAVPAVGSTFTGWTGGSCGGTGLCNITLGANTTITATFTLAVVLDIAPPIISAVDANPVTHNTAKLLWTTNESATTQVEYGLTTAYGNTTALQSTLVTDHTVNLSGLTSNTVYHYRVRSKDSAGNESVSVDKVFTTAILDVLPPVISINAPSGGVTVAGSLTISALASDPLDSAGKASGIAGVQFKLDSSNLGQELDTVPYSGLWNTLGVSDGQHTLTAVARDGAGNTTASSPVTVTVTNIVPDTTSPSIPEALLATVVSPYQINLSWNASTDNTAVTLYKIYRDGVVIGTSGGTYYSDTGLLDSTLYSYSVSAVDAVSNESAKAVSVSSRTLAKPIDNPVPATLYNGSPNRVFAAGTTETTLSLNTDKQADCRYSQAANTAFRQMSGIFTTASGITHTAALTGLANGKTYTYFVRCEDRAGLITTADYIISFSVALPPVSLVQGIPVILNADAPKTGILKPTVVQKRAPAAVKTVSSKGALSTKTPTKTSGPAPIGVATTDLTKIDIAVPQMPSWIEVVKDMTKTIYETVKRGALQTYEAWSVTFIDLVGY